MSTPIIKSGKFSAGYGFKCGENVVIEVDEEVVFGNRCVLGDNAYISGRKVIIGNDFFNYTWEWRRLDVGRGRRGEEHAVLTVGDRCTFHDDRIDLARSVHVGNDVGLSPEVVVYTHGYWQSVLDGYPAKRAPVTICDGALVGFRSTVLAGAVIGPGCMVGAGSVVSGTLPGRCIAGGVPAKRIKDVEPLDPKQRRLMIEDVLLQYDQHVGWRDGRNYELGLSYHGMDWSRLKFRGVTFDFDVMTCEGEEDAATDDLRWFLFQRGLRFYTERPFAKLER